MKKKVIQFLMLVFFYFMLMPVAVASPVRLGLTLREIFQPIFSLIIVIGLIYGTVFLYSKLNKYNFAKFSKISQKSLDISRLSLVSHLSLGQNKSVDVVNINGKNLVLGVTGNNITLLKEFDENSLNNSEETGYKSIKTESAKLDKSLKTTELYKKYLRGADVQKY